jgi:hypothetical protein
MPNRLALVRRAAAGTPAGVPAARQHAGRPRQTAPLLLFNVKSSRHGCGNRSAAGSYYRMSGACCTSKAAKRRIIAYLSRWGSERQGPANGARVWAAAGMKGLR